MKQSTVIKNTVNSIYMKQVIENKKWTKQQAANKVLEFLTCGKAISFHDFMEAQ